LLPILTRAPLNHDLLEIERPLVPQASDFRED
jgi:hypothetical protein